MDTTYSRETCIAHEKNILDYLETHKMIPGMIKFKRNLLFSIVFLTLFIIFNREASKIVKFFKSVQILSTIIDIYLTKGAYIVSLIILLALFFFFVYFLIASTKELILKITPRFIFLISMLKSLQIEFSLLAAASVACFLPATVSDFLNKLSSTGSFALLNWNSSISNSEKLDSNSQNQTMFSQIFEAVVVFTFKNVIIFFLNFYVNSRYYKDRIDLNMKRIKYIQRLNNIVGESGTNSIKIISSKVFSHFSRDQKTLTISDLQTSFLEEEAKELMSFFTDESNENIGKDDIKDFYVATLVEQKLIVESIAFSNSTIKNLNWILNIAVIPSIIYVIAKQFEFLFNHKILSSNSVPLITIILSSSYAFSDVIKSFIASIYLIVFIRPFECSDIIKIKEKYWKVVKVGLLKTHLDNGSTIEVVPNSKLITESIVNLRLTRLWIENYTFTLNSDLYEKNKENLLKTIARMIEEKGYEIKKNCNFSKTKILPNGKLEVTVEARFKIDEPNIQHLQVISSNFLIDLKNIISDMNLQA